MTTKNQFLKRVFVVGTILLIIDVLWLAYTVITLHKDYSKTTAIVSGIRFENPSHTGGGQQINYYPTFTYLDSAGVGYSHESSDGFNRFTRFIFGVEEGDEITVFYSNNNPESIFPVYGFNYCLLLFWPFIFGFVALVVSLLIVLIKKLIKMRFFHDPLKVVGKYVKPVEKHRDIILITYESYKSYTVFSAFLGSTLFGILLLNIDVKTYWPYSLLLFLSVPGSVLSLRMLKK